MTYSLRLRVQKIDDQSVQITWTDEYDRDVIYRIALTHVSQAAASVRDELQKMMEHYMRDPQSELARKAMRNLLTAGRDLFGALFLATSDRGNAVEAREAYAEFDQAGRLRLAIKVDPALTYPFALAVPVDDGFDQIVANLTLPHQAFWGLRHDLSISVTNAGSLRRHANGLEYRSLAAVNRTIFDRAVKSMTEENEKLFLDVLCKRWGEELTFTFGDFMDATKRTGADPAAKLRIAYLYGHASGDRFQLAKDDEITAAALASRLGDHVNRAERQQTFLFLNGCDTSAEGQRFAFTGLLGYPNITGLIGTEVRVPDRFAFRFALGFFRLVIFEGQTFREAISVMRREHLPISLVYTLYAPDGISLARQPDAKMPSLADGPKANFSEGQLKCGV
jgi:hypothetical protein